MESVRHWMCPLHCDVRRQKAVGAAHPGNQFALYIGVEMHDLHQCVNTGVGAPGAQSRNTLAGQFAERGFQLVLHRSARALALPAFVSLTVVADAEGQPHNTIIDPRRCSMELGEQMLGLRPEFA